MINILPLKVRNVSTEVCFVLILCSMSMGFLVEEKSAVVWRGLMVRLAA